MDGEEMKEIKEVAPQWWAGTRGHWHPTELCLEMTAVKRPNQQQNLRLIFSYQTQHQKGRKIRMEKRKNKFLNQKEGRDVQLLREGTGRAVVAVLHPNPRTNSSRSKSSKPCTVFPCRTSGAFKKNSKKVEIQAKAVIVLPPVILAGEWGSRRRNLYLNQFCWTQESKILVERPSGGEGTSGGLR